MLNLYFNKCTEPHGGGMCIVAAASEAEAHSIANEKLFDYKAVNYHADSWELIEGATVFEPARVIAERSYVE